MPAGFTVSEVTSSGRVETRWNDAPPSEDAKIRDGEPPRAAYAIDPENSENAAPPFTADPGTTTVHVAPASSLCTMP